MVNFKWLLFLLKESEARDLLEIVEARHKKASTIFCSHFDIADRQANLTVPMFAESAISHVHAAAQGITRVINLICSQALYDAK